MHMARLPARQVIKTRGAVGSLTGEPEEDESGRAGDAVSFADGDTLPFELQVRTSSSLRCMHAVNPTCALRLPPHPPWVVSLIHA